LSVQFEGGSVFEWQTLILRLLSAMAFAILFYNYIGQWFLDKLFEWIKKIFSEKFGNGAPQQPTQPPADNKKE
jgi:Kef-type K+ transport system membrane component KefB